MSKTFYNGEVVMDFREDRHQYFIEGRQVPSVTQITDIVAKPALRRWYSNVTADYFKEALKPGMAIDELFIEEVYKGAKSAPFKRRDRAGDLGTIVHKECEHYIEAKIRGGEYTTELVNSKARSAYERFVGWFEGTDITPLATEQMVYNRSAHYAGTFDLLAEKDGKLSIYDIKTSKGVYDEHFPQMAAYAMAIRDGCFEEYKGRTIGDTAIIHVPVVEERLDVRTSRNEFDVDCEAFLSMRQLYSWAKGL